MRYRSAEGTINKIAWLGPIVTASCAVIVPLHAVLYDMMGKGKLGQTDDFVMLAPILLYFVAAIASLALTWILSFYKRLAAVWYFVSSLICIAGLVMAWNEMENYIGVV